MFFRRIKGNSPSAKRVEREEARKGGAVGPMGGLAGANGPFGALFHAKRDAPFMFFKTPSGGIPAISGTVPGSAECDVMTWDGTDLSLNSVGLKAVVLNPWSAATSSAKLALAIYWQGAWWVTQWNC